ncbi:MAG: M23 family metallopeptidase [Elusimicrobia bacterium]|nr:M23 family metallopeptidase [Elusimicrobiota bacterium]
MKEFWTRRITLVAIPTAADLPSWRACLSLRLIVLAAAGWAGLTLLVLILGAQLADYGMLKADNTSLRARLASLAAEMARSRAELDAGRAADQQVRALLRLPPHSEAARPAAATVSSGSGGPGPADRALLQQLLREPARVTADPLRGDLADLRRLSRERVASYKEIAAHLAWRSRLLQATPRGWPIPGRITSKFGYRFSPMSPEDEVESREFHPGLDIADALGTPIRATADGTVVRARWSGGYGRLVMLRHDLGYATLYGHASRFFVREGERVQRGQVIAATGSTGRSTGSHVHYEVWWNGKAINPAKFLKD